MLTNYVVVAFISLLVSVVIFSILFKRKSIEQDSITKKLKQKIDKLVDDHNHALGDAEHSLKTKEKELRDYRNKLIGSQEELKKHKALIRTLSQQNHALGDAKNRLKQKEEELRSKQNILVEAQEKLKRLEARIRVLSQYEGIANIDEAINKKKRHFLAERNKAIVQLKQQIKQTKEKIKAATLELRERQNIVNKSIEAKEKKIQSDVQRTDELIQKKKTEAEQVVKEMYKEAKKKHEEIFMSSSADAAEIIVRAEQQAKELAGDSLKAVANEKQLERAIRAMKNTIKGYGEEYLIPSYGLLDELADEYDFKKAGQELKKVREGIRLMIKNETAADCDYVETNRRHYAIHFVLDAFNGKVDSVLAKVRQNNYGKLRQQLLDAFNLVNHNGAAFRSARINQQYLDLRLEELKWAVAAHELQVQDREEQKRIKQEMREEAKAKKEYEKAIKEAEKEEKILKKAMDQARQELLSASGTQREEYEARLKNLEEKLQEAEEKNQRAISMAQQTKKGHVYVISNVGSFGDSVLKIGLTRRLEPMDRVKELGGASVPFPFDVHAMMFSEDAPALERELHQTFNKYQVNKANQRKEFFRINVADVKGVAANLGIEALWTMTAEAREYRESISIAKSQKNTPKMAA